MAYETTELGVLVAKLVGRRVRELRINAELSQGQLARKLRSHRTIVARVERGKHALCVRDAGKYARALGVDAAVLLVCLDTDWIAAGQEARAWAAELRAAG